MTASAPLRIGLVGAGMISGYHLTAWRRCPGAEVVAIADPSEAAARGRAGEFAVAQVFADADAMMDAVRPDAVDIAAPMEFHAGICRAAADRGIAIMCQKPLCPTLGEARALVAEIGGRVPFAVHENWRFRPPYRAIRRWLDDGRIGRVRAFTMEVMTGGLIPDLPGQPPPALRRQPFMAGMPRFTVLEGMIHQIDTLRFLLDGLSVAGARLARLSDRVVGEDTAMILFESPAGAIGTLSHSLAVPGAAPRSSDTLTLIGERGTIGFRDWVLSCSDGGPAETWEREAAYQASFDAVMAQFAGWLRGGPAFETTAAENLATLALVDDVYRLAGWPSEG
ncbi:MAG: Gfo/Idh/MocA family oxidoreductase [Thalassobaculum sp.]|uniref:Gfo/Idh/MocA family protein n=1 Tax=Thalassobaculum sp. TaxID=2022740 RepID=UPI0032EC3F8A